MRLIVSTSTAIRIIDTYTMDSPSTDELDFEIDFYRGILDLNPGYLEVLMALGNAYTKRGLYNEGLDIDQRLARLRPHDPVVLYNLACSFSLVGLLDEAFDALERALHLGFSDFALILEDQDLENLRHDPRFGQLILNHFSY